MSTLPIRAPHVSFTWPLAGFARVKSVVTTMLEVFGEAQSGASAAQQRFPFAAW